MHSVSNKANNQVVDVRVCRNYIPLSLINITPQVALLADLHIPHYSRRSCKSTQTRRRSRVGTEIEKVTTDMGLDVVGPPPPLAIRHAYKRWIGQERHRVASMPPASAATASGHRQCACLKPSDRSLGIVIICVSTYRRAPASWSAVRCGFQIETWMLIGVEESKDFNGTRHGEPLSYHTRHKADALGGPQLMCYERLSWPCLAASNSQTSFIAAHLRTSKPHRMENIRL